ncbi:hypothetical protein ACIRPT_18825 [Streptomyces sp. NPDC101227]|uniref:hypothetical protein n=1 Tax=Streptomyces sp. NPDC101227 TaxID=3366136 RepID=UPI00382C8A8F
MRKIREAAVVVAVLGSVGLLGAGAGTAYAGGGTDVRSYSRVQPNYESTYRQQSSGGHHHHGRSHGHKTIIRQNTSCRAYDKNVDVFGEVAIGNGLLGHGYGHKHRPGVQSTRMGLSLGCDNIIRL